MKLLLAKTILRTAKFGVCLVAVSAWALYGAVPPWMVLFS